VPRCAAFVSSDFTPGSRCTALESSDFTPGSRCTAHESSNFTPGSRCTTLVSSDFTPESRCAALVRKGVGRISSGADAGKCFSLVEIFDDGAGKAVPDVDEVDADADKGVADVKFRSAHAQPGRPHVYINGPHAKFDADYMNLYSALQKSGLPLIQSPVIFPIPGLTIPVPYLTEVFPGRNYGAFTFFHHSSFITKMRSGNVKHQAGILKGGVAT
jgi:hypothetical protein